MKRIEIQVHEQTFRYKFGPMSVREEVACAVIMVRRADGSVELPCAGYGDTDVEAVADLVNKYRVIMAANRRANRMPPRSTVNPYEHEYRARKAAN